MPSVSRHYERWLHTDTVEGHAPTLACWPATRWFRRVPSAGRREPAPTSTTGRDSPQITRHSVRFWAPGAPLRFACLRVVPESETPPNRHGTSFRPTVVGRPT